MLFRKRPAVVPSPTPSPIPRELTAEQDLVQALRNYRQQFERTLESQSDQHIGDAKAVLLKARKLIGESGLGAALAPTLIEEVMHWHAWVTRPNLLQWVKFPASEISAEQAKNIKEHTTTRTTFTYKNCPYTVMFTDEGYNSHIPDSDWYTGKAEFIAKGDLVLGLDISKEMWPDYKLWSWSNIFAFTPGEWMKDLIEISTIIEKRRGDSLKQFSEDDALARAKNIRL
jgi:hypothetical protein